MERHFAEGFAANVLTVAEALVHPTYGERQDAAMTSLIRIGVQVNSLDPSDAGALARVRNTYRVRMPNAVALHTAIRTGSALATFDHSLAAAAERAGIRTVS